MRLVKAAIDAMIDPTETLTAAEVDRRDAREATTAIPVPHKADISKADTNEKADQPLGSTTTVAVDTTEKDPVERDFVETNETTDRTQATILGKAATNATEVRRKAGSTVVLLPEKDFGATPVRIAKADSTETSVSREPKAALSVRPGVRCRIERAPSDQPIARAPVMSGSTETLSIDPKKTWRPK